MAGRDRLKFSAAKLFTSVALSMFSLREAEEASQWHEVISTTSR